MDVKQTSQTSTVYKKEEATCRASRRTVKYSTHTGSIAFIHLVGLSETVAST